jgi:hypothetical protein
VKRLASIPLLLLLLPLFAATTVGCAHQKKQASGPLPSDRTLVRLDPTLVRTELFAFIDTYGATIAQPADDLIAATGKREVATWALRYKITSATVLLTDAAAANPIGGMLDAVIYVSLERSCLEDHWVPTLLGPEGQALLQATRRGEAEAWAMAQKFLSPPQIAELKAVIDRWRKEHPGQYYVGNIRFADLGAYRQYGADPATAKPGSVFSLLYLNPLPSLDPVAEELRQYRLLTERLTFVLVRMPALMSWRVEQAMNLVVDLPQADRIIASTTQVAGASDRLVDVFAKYPADLSIERKAAIEQWMTGMDAQRREIQKELDSEHSRLGATLEETRQTIASARSAAASITDSANQTAHALRHDSEELITLTTRAAIVLILAASLIPVLAILLYRWASRRMRPSPPSAP